MAGGDQAAAEEDRRAFPAHRAEVADGLELAFVRQWERAEVFNQTVRWFCADLLAGT